MASAGQAQAHGSQPMHFSSPSGHRFSWWRPWNRGAVGRFSSGYWTVSTFRNICRNVTPNPLTGSKKSGTGHLLDGAARNGIWFGRRAAGAGGYPDAVVMRQIHGGNGEAAGSAGTRAGLRDDGPGGGRRGPRIGRGGFRGRPGGGAPLLRGRVARPGQQQQGTQDRPAHDVHGSAAAVLPPYPDGRDHQDPGERGGDEHLPPERHELVVPDPRQRAPQPYEPEQQDQYLGQEPQQRPPAAVRARPHRDRPGRAPAAEEQGGGQRGA